MHSVGLQVLFSVAALLNLVFWLVVRLMSPLSKDEKKRGHPILCSSICERVCSNCDVSKVSISDFLQIDDCYVVDDPDSYNVYIDIIVDG